jgi:hypothetical protein
MSDTRHQPLPRHVKVTGRQPVFGYERCEDQGCVVEVGGVASSCGRTACPACGAGGSNLTALSGGEAGSILQCTCGNAWIAPASVTPFTHVARPPFSAVDTRELASWL